MDTSLQYVRMCKGATEIQDQWKFEKGDYFSSITQAELQERTVSAGQTPDTKGCSIVDQWWIDDEYTKSRLEKGESLPVEWAWLPRQDQLQEMLSDEQRIVHKDTAGYKTGCFPEGFIAMITIDCFHTFLDDEYEYTSYIGFNSMEQLWLAYVSDHVYEKRWNGSEWIPSIGGT